MSTSNPPRFLPTLTEVVTPDAFVPPEPTQWVPESQAHKAATSVSEEDTALITRNVLAKITPLLEQQLRDSAQELFEVQVNVVLPALHRHVEAAVKQAIEETLAQRSAHANESNP